MDVKQMRLADITPYAKNAKKHDKTHSAKKILPLELM